MKICISSTIVLNKNLERIVSIRPDVVVEASSVIKLFLAALFLYDLQKSNLKLSDNLEVKTSHIANTIGWSRRVRWQPCFMSISQIIQMSLSQSDSVATNVIIDFLGGQKKINERFAELGCSSTQLATARFGGELTNYRRFLVGTTTANDCLTLLKDVFIKRTILYGKYLAILIRVSSLSPLHTEYQSSSMKYFCHKTGTSFNGKKLTLNDVGIIYNHSAKALDKVVILLTTQMFTGEYYGSLFFDRLTHFDKGVKTLADLD